MGKLTEAQRREVAAWVDFATGVSEYLARRWGSRDPDLPSEAYLALCNAVQAKPAALERGRLRRWIYVWVRNHLVAYLRAQRRLESRGLVGGTSLDLDKRPAPVRRVSPHETIARLPDALRNVAELRHGCGLQVNEVARRLRLPVRTVTRRLKQARHVARLLRDSTER